MLQWRAHARWPGPFHFRGELPAKKFEESCQRKSCQRNPKLFDGQYCSLVHMQNGKYQVHLRTINASAIVDRNQLAFNVYSELLNAFSIID